MKNIWIERRADRLALAIHRRVTELARAKLLVEINSIRWPKEPNATRTAT